MLCNRVGLPPKRGKGNFVSYGKLIIERELTKAEARQLERDLSNKAWYPLGFDGWKIKVLDVQVGEHDGNVQYITVRATA